MIENEKTGFLFNAGDSQDLVNKIQALYTNEPLQNEMVVNCLKKEHMTEDKYYDILIGVYEKGI